MAICLAIPASLPQPARAAEPNAAAAARHLAQTLGGAPNDFVLVQERTGVLPHGAGALWAAKFVDSRTGRIHAVYRDPGSGGVGGSDLPSVAAANARNALTALESKADAALLDALSAVHVAAADTEQTIPVGVWLDVDYGTVDASVAARHPELVWEGGRPLVSDLGLARALRSELAAAYAVARTDALARLRNDAEALGARVGYVSTNAPLAYLDVPASRVGDVAALPSVATIGLERTWTPAMSSAGPASQADWTGGAEDQGTGVRVAIVEYHNVRNTGDLAGRVVATHSTSGTPAYATGGEFDHPSWVAGAIASGNPTYPGVAPGAHIVSSSTGGGGVSLARDRDIIAAADWAASAAGGDADVINASIGQDTAIGSEEARRYFDALVYEQGRLAVAAAGNFTTFGHWDVVSPGTAYNVLTVGGIDDRGSVDRLDDGIWYQPGINGSNYRDPAGTEWNPHGDFNKPNVSAPATSVRTANGLAATGTSAASPIVAGIAAQLISRDPTLLLWPEATRALIMAGAVNRSSMPDGSRNADHEGTGTASAMWSNRLLNAGDGRYGGYRVGSVGAEGASHEISVVAGQRVKVVVSWNSRTSGAERTDRLVSDLDLRIHQPDGSAAGSFTYDNNYEWVEVIASRTGTMRIELVATRLDGGPERFGVAWAKVNLGTPARIAGADRYATAAALSAWHFAPGVPVAFVATGRNFPDALAGGPAAGILGGPVLLTDTTSLPQATRDELTRLQPHQIFVLGGPGAVSDTVAAQLQGYTAAPVQRLHGADRYETAAAVSRAVFAPNVPAAFVATGQAFPDALSAGPAAVRTGGPVLLTRGTSLPEVTGAELARLRPATVYLLGGTGAVSDAVVAQIRAASGAPVVRIAGADRYATAVAVSAAFFGSAPDAFVATGRNFPDALAAVPVAGRAASPLLLVAGSSVPPAVVGELRRLEPVHCYLAGGPGAVSDGVASYLAAVLGRP